jgi:hypothetical protein
LIVVVVLLVFAGFVAFVVVSTPPVTTPTTNTSISAGPDIIISSVVQTNPSGFVLESSKPELQVGGTQAGWAVLGQPDGTVANLTVVVYDSDNASQAYLGRLVANVKGLTGYTDVTSDLATFQQYGRCYGYGEDVDGIGVANGVCTKGNVFLQVHLVSAVPFSTLETYLTSLMGALYQNAS